MAEKKRGLRLEARVAKELADAGWWAHRIEPNRAGQQPCDVCAMRKGSNILIDAKECSGGRFDLSRIEPDQRQCFDIASRRGVPCGFALAEPNGRIGFLPWAYASKIERLGRKSVRLSGSEWEELAEGWERIKCAS